MSMDASRYTIQAVDKALDLMELLADEGSMSLIELWSCWPMKDR
ncbi:MAG: hypothetical protein K0R75_886 [Paenibacillaceae bacterium]|nr:hypothetical protein [Paenibacillaceae bacterium]